MPTDGVTALFRNGSTGTNSQTNCAAQTGSISAVPDPAAALFLFSGLAALRLVRRTF